MEKQQLQQRQKEILDLIRAFCEMKLDDEYYELAERLIAKLGRKRNPIFASGKKETWACAAIHALGTINFLFDKSFEPYATIDEINEFFGTSKSNSGTKSKQIRDLLKLNYFDNEFSTLKMKTKNPFAQMVMVDGFIVPISTLPEEYQIAVREARAEGKDIEFRTR